MAVSAECSCPTSPKIQRAARTASNTTIRVRIGSLLRFWTNDRLERLPWETVQRPRCAWHEASRRNAPHVLLMQLAMKLQLLSASSFSLRDCRLQSLHFTFSCAHFFLAASHYFRSLSWSGPKSLWSGPKPTARPSARP